MKDVQKMDFIYKIILTIMIFTYIIINIFVKDIFKSSYIPFIQAFTVLSYIFIAKLSKSIAINTVLICLTIILFIISLFLMFN
ncbi:hypothetical protein [Lactococcus petauri]|uniref:hypothetical protein n=2 Tax=Lactococcus petauri TaxID=1940789 RepID=UPI00254A74CA|nr:hypothetical protein [Lactococcus petauri]